MVFLDSYNKGGIINISMIFLYELYTLKKTDWKTEFLIGFPCSLKIKQNNKYNNTKLREFKNQNGKVFVWSEVFKNNYLLYESTKK